MIKSTTIYIEDNNDDDVGDEHDTIALQNNPKHILHQMMMRIKIITRNAEDDNDDDVGDEQDAIEDV